MKSRRVVLSVRGMTCQGCVKKLSAALLERPGVEHVAIDLAAGEAEVAFDGERTDLARVRQAIEDAGFASGPEEAELKPASAAPPKRSPAARPIRLQVSGMRCAACVASVERALRQSPGVTAAHVRLALGEAVAWVEPDLAGPTAERNLVDALRRAGYDGEPAASDLDATPGEEWWWWLGRALTAALAWVVLMVVGEPLVAVVIGTVLHWGLGWPFHYGAAQRLRHGDANMDTLVSLGTTAAWLRALGELLGSGTEHGHAPFVEVAMILCFLSFGKFLEARLRRAASRDLRGLLQLRPAQVRVISDDRTNDVPLATVAAGMRVEARVGERIGVDGRVVQGEGEVDESWLTGESHPVLKRPGDSVLAGSLNLNGVLRIDVEGAAGDSQLDHIANLIRTSQDARPRAQRVADEIVRWFTPTVAGVALVVLAVWAWLGEPAYGWTRATTVLVISCPCAMGLATPLALMAAVGRLAAVGVFVRRGDALEIAPAADCVALDKTGVLTRGRPEVSQLLPEPGVSESHLLEAAAIAESAAAHPIAEAILRVAGPVGIVPAEDFRQEIGLGVSARVGSRRLLAGNRRWLTRKGIATGDAVQEDGRQGATEVWVSENAQLLGRILLEDTIPSSHRDFVRSLRGRGARVVILSGDRQAAVDHAGECVDADAYAGDLTPGEKRDRIRRWQAEGQRVMMVGDGVNDAPALAQADVGVAMGGGADLAAENADLVLLRGGLGALSRGLNIARGARTIIRQNLAWALGYNMVLIPWAAGLFVGWGAVDIPPAAAAAAMALSSVSVALNSLRLRWFGAFG